jgi:hypothetical protein
MEPLELMIHCVAHPFTLPAWTVATAESTYLTYLNAKEKKSWDDDYSPKTYLWGYATGINGACVITSAVLALENLLY